MGTSWIEVIYWVSTITGGTLFILRTVLLLFGGGLGDHTLDAGLDIPHSTDFDLSGDIHTDIHMDIEADHAEAYASFKLLSLQGLTAFFMMFGLVGLALTKANLPVLVTVLGGRGRLDHSIHRQRPLFANEKAAIRRHHPHQQRDR